MSNRISIETLQNIPHIEPEHDLIDVIVGAIKDSGQNLKNNDILCVASKIVSITEGRQVKLDDVEVTDKARSIQQKIPRKDPRIVQLIINETGAQDGSRVEVSGDYIGGWLPNGLRLTSAGVDKFGTEEAILLPKNPDASAKRIGEGLMAVLGVTVGVVITDSDGRMEKRGATQIAIGLYGVPGLRVHNKVEETVCDMLAASAAIIMGQRGTNKPVVIVRGFEYQHDPSSTILDTLTHPNLTGMDS